MSNTVKLHFIKFTLCVRAAIAHQGQDQGLEPQGHGLNLQGQGQDQGHILDIAHNHTVRLMHSLNALNINVRKEYNVD